MTQDIRNRLFDQFEMSVVDHGWTEISCARLAHRANVDLHEAYAEYPTRFSYVSDLIRRIDRTMLDDFDTALADEPARDRLFDVLMGRFDAMQDHRALIVSLSKAAKYDPMLAMHLCALSALTGEWIMEMAHISSAGMMGQVRNKGALLAYGRAFAIWLEDESEDLSRTMAVLDKILHRGERALCKTEKLLCRMNKLRKCCSRSSFRDRRSGRRTSEPVSSVDESEGLATVS
ncbi:hypothetical protein [Cohaesibacter gelatinilyticus]|uniref:Transcriptional regulator, TetR family n=1 Tax=Cohaesibacter gelatinilyticus TaxID=372072 RepID=A0A285PGN3_9HYPH|nr:hypothetical protein [Cohaesibacter gelatinilyticus]SNZ20872.1 transcriptional regulator, TetR family [Cohaesibacter gelatinilyticus]